MSPELVAAFARYFHHKGAEVSEDGYEAHLENNYKAVSHCMFVEGRLYQEYLRAVAILHGMDRLDLLGHRPVLPEGAQLMSGYLVYWK